MTLEFGMNTKARVIEALRNNGYELGPDVLSIKYLRTNDETGQEIHKIVFTNDEGERDEGLAYVWAKDGKLFADF